MGAVDDVTAWCLQAVAIAVARTGDFAGAIPTIIASIVYIGLMLTADVGSCNALPNTTSCGTTHQLLLAGIYMAVVASALITELIGIHLFLTFLWEQRCPKIRFSAGIGNKNRRFCFDIFAAHIFCLQWLKDTDWFAQPSRIVAFVCVGFRNRIAGKYVGTYVAARVSGISKRQASALGWLMNTRSLTELIVLNIGLELGVISPLIFTMLVIMALVTTFMTSPLLEWTYPKK